VRPDHRRRGVGRTLLARAMRGAREVVLDPTPETIAVYAKLGFTLERRPRGRCFCLDSFPYQR
jgi:GNAT superfamily N-acetyltransferase